MNSLLASLLVALSSAAQDPAVPNPVMAGADPHAAVIDGRLWIYPTNHPPGDPKFFAFSSSDMRRWDRHGPVLSFSEIPWIKEDGEPNHYAWAPALAERNGTYYFYFSVGPQGRTPARIGVGSGKSPAGPFKDSGRPLLVGGNGFEAIDPMVFRDPKSGRYFLYAGGSAGAKLRIFELDDTMMRMQREIPVETPPKFTEGAFVHYRKGVYYLTYSHGGWRTSGYSGHYATSATPVGPWRYRGSFLTSSERHKGPGHHSVFRGPGEDEWYIAYHRWNDAQGDGPYQGSRQIAIDRLVHEHGTWLRSVQMTDSVPVFAPTPSTPGK
ncbi:MAG TPA: family 43 glycosylhydrolase [Fimbriimonas sp.]